MNEAQMRIALGLESRSKAVPIAITPGLTVLLSVREKWGGRVRRFVHKSNTLSSLQARIEAERVAREQGFIVWVLLDIQ